jgi:hypothetical protein
LVAHYGDDCRVNPSNLHFRTHYPQEESEEILIKITNPSFLILYVIFFGEISWEFLENLSNFSKNTEHLWMNLEHF